MRATLDEFDHEMFAMECALTLGTMVERLGRGEDVNIPKTVNELSPKMARLMLAVAVQLIGSLMEAGKLTYNDFADLPHAFGAGDPE